MVKNRNSRNATAASSVELILPAELYVANLLPGHIGDVLDFWTADQLKPGHPRRQETAAETAQFERFLDEHFPREKFTEFRRYIDNPPYPYLPGVCIASEQVGEADPKPSKIWTYRILVETRRKWRATAKCNWLIAEKNNKTLPPIRICEFCELVFVARRKDQLTCDDTCASGRRMRRKREKAKIYEQNRERKKAAKEFEQKQKGKGAAR
jgi:hypothetical protein